MHNFVNTYILIDAISGSKKVVDEKLLYAKYIYLFHYRPCTYMHMLQIWLELKLVYVCSKMCKNVPLNQQNTQYYRWGRQRTRQRFRMHAMRWNRRRMGWWAVCNNILFVAFELRASIRSRVHKLRKEAIRNEAFFLLLKLV